VIVISKLYPHTDFVERGADLYYLVRDAAAGRHEVAMRHVAIPMIGVYPTAAEPMQDLLGKMDDMEATSGVLSTSLVHGFPWSDNPDMGAGALVVTDNDWQLAQNLAESLASAFLDIREFGIGSYLSVKDAVTLALDSESGLLVIADIADNPGGGCPGDGTFLLKAFIDAGVSNVAFMMIYDPDCVRLAMAAGVGSSLQVVLGGKFGDLSGPSLELEVDVIATAEAAWQCGLSSGVRESLGASACIRVGEIYVIVNSIRQQAFSPDPLLQLRVDPAGLRTIVVKSSHHFERGFADIADRIVHCSATGCLSTDFAQLPYRRIRRPMLPLDAIEELR